MYSGRMNSWGLSFWTETYFWMTICQIAGVLLLGYIYANFTKLLMQKNYAETEFRRVEEMIMQEIDGSVGSKLPEEMQDRIKAYFKYRYHTTNFGPLLLLDERIMTPSMRA